VGGEELADLGINLVAVIGASLLCHTDAAVRLKGSLEGLVGLETNDGLLALVQIAGTMGGDGGDNLGVHIQNAAGLSFLLLQIQYLCPQIFCVLCRAGQESVISVIGMIVFLDEITDIDFMFPLAAYKLVPFRSHLK
jgi:hypothetical protein